jgi:hypothetical protein
MWQLHSVAPKRRSGHGQATFLASVYSGIAAKQLHTLHKCRAENRPTNLSGTWKKVNELSESIDPTADLFELSFLARRGAKLANTLIIDDTDNHFCTSVQV